MRTYEIPNYEIIETEHEDVVTVSGNDGAFDTGEEF